MPRGWQELELKGFGGTAMAPGEDAVFDKVVHPGTSKHVQFIRWDSSWELRSRLLDGVRGVHRLILIGDPRQLPPIGAGRPFVDIVNRLAPEGISERFPRVGRGYAELTIRRRQSGEDREDL